MRTPAIAAGMLLLSLVIFSNASAFADPGTNTSPGITLQQPTTPAETSPPVTPTPTPSAAGNSDPSTISTVTTYLSTAVLIGAIAWSFWYRRRKAKERSNNFRM